MLWSHWVLSCSVCGFCIWLLQLTWHGLLFKAADKVDTGPLGRDRRKPGGQIRMPRERSQDHAPAQHTKVSGDTRWTLSRGWGQKTGDTGADMGGDSGMSPSYGATGIRLRDILSVWEFLNLTIFNCWFQFWTRWVRYQFHRVIPCQRDWLVFASSDSWLIQNSQVSSE